MNATEDRHALFVVTVSTDLAFRATVCAALFGLASEERRFQRPRNGHVVRDAEWPEVCTTLTTRARIFLDHALPRASIQLIDITRLDRLPQELHRHLTQPAEARQGPQPWSANATVLFLIDAATAVTGTDIDSRLDATTETLRRLQDELGIGVSPYSVVVYDDLNEDRVYSRTQFTTRKTPDQDWVLAAETIAAFTDLVQARYANARAMLPDTDAPATVATALTGFLTEQAGDAWSLHFLTGSIISKLIQDATAIARRAGNPVLRGPSEHSLACGALARWQVQSAPFLLVATAGMANELKGTLANLRDSQARGFIIFGENDPHQWQPFQGTMHEHENSQSVFHAYGLQCFYLTDPNRVADDLTAAFRAYHRRRGPIVLLASPSVLRHTGVIELPKVAPVMARPKVDEDTLDTVANLLNHDPSSILWQCGKLSEEESDLVHDIARRAGIALVDSLGRPGTVARYRNGRVVDEYLGTMSLYGCSSEVWSFLHPDGRMLPYNEHALFFLKSRILDLATPVAEKTLHDNARIIQVTDTPSHIAPFTDIPVVERLHSFMHRLAGCLDPDEDVVRARRAAIAQARCAPRDPLTQVPSIPMSHEYFFTRLNEVLTGLIVDHRYDYTGCYDVGRGGISAVRNLARTRPGFSGWYGRALMGDALLSIPSLALSHPGNLLGFIGDGAANLVPSIMPILAQQLQYESGRLEGNVSIFFLLNGGFSIIRSYRELQHAATADAQMSLLTPVAPAWQQTWGEVTVTHERITTVDQEHLAKRLLEPATINLFSVYLSHDNEGDDIMPLSRKNWRMR